MNNNRTFIPVDVNSPEFQARYKAMEAKCVNEPKPKRRGKDLVILPDEDTVDEMKVKFIHHPELADLLKNSKHPNVLIAIILFRKFQLDYTIYRLNTNDGYQELTG